MDDHSLFSEMAGRLDTGTAVALATVVAATGSTPQKPGAKMAVLPDGSTIGTVGGGCVEGTVKSACLEALLKTKKTRLIEAELTDDPGTRDGDVCGGIMTLLVEPIFP